MSFAPFDVFFGDSFLGTGVCDHGISYHYLCPVCGTIWARTICSATSQHSSLIRHCPDHARALGLGWGDGVIYEDFRFYRCRWPKESLARDFLYLCDLKDAQIIAHN